MDKPEITPAFLSDLKDKAKKAMPGPWAYGTDAEKFGAKYPDSNRVYANLHPQDDPVYGILLTVNHNLKLCDTTARFIAAANPQAILELIDRVEELEEADNPQALTALGLIYADREKDLKKRIAQLEKEADWLATRLEERDIADHYERRIELQDMREKKDWREAARKAVEGK